ncbi:hypothetical protein P9112_012290 [Eukaryota sp. TZLM1-RC]
MLSTCHHQAEYSVLLPGRKRLCLVCTQGHSQDPFLLNSLLLSLTESINFQAPSLTFCTFTLELIDPILHNSFKIAKTNLLESWFHILSHPNFCTMISTMDKPLSNVLSLLEDCREPNDVYFYCIRSMLLCPPDLQLIFLSECHIYYFKSIVSYFLNFLKTEFAEQVLEILGDFLTKVHCTSGLKELIYDLLSNFSWKTRFQNAHSGLFVSFLINLLNSSQFFISENVPIAQYLSILPLKEIEFVTEIIGNYFTNDVKENGQLVEILIHLFTSGLLNSHSLQHLSDEITIPLLKSIYLSSDYSLNIIGSKIHLLFLIVSNFGHIGGGSTDVLANKPISSIISPLINTIVFNINEQKSHQLIHQCFLLLSKFLNEITSSSLHSQWLNIFTASINVEALPIEYLGPLSEIFGLLMSTCADVSIESVNFLNQLVIRCLSFVDLENRNLELVGPVEDIGSGLLCLLLNVNHLEASIIENGLDNYIVPLAELDPELTCRCLRKWINSPHFDSNQNHLGIVHNTYPLLDTNSCFLGFATELCCIILKIDDSQIHGSPEQIILIKLFYFVFIGIEVLDGLDLDSLNTPLFNKLIEDTAFLKLIVLVAKISLGTVTEDDYKLPIMDGIPGFMLHLVELVVDHSRYLGNCNVDGLVRTVLTSFLSQTSSNELIKLTQIQEKVILTILDYIVNPTKTRRSDTLMKLVQDTLNVICRIKIDIPITIIESLCALFLGLLNEELFPEIFYFLCLKSGEIDNWRQIITPFQLSSQFLSQIISPSCNAVILIGIGLLINQEEMLGESTIHEALNTPQLIDKMITLLTSIIKSWALQLKSNSYMLSTRDRASLMGSSYLLSSLFDTHNNILGYCGLNSTLSELLYQMDELFPFLNDIAHSLELFVLLKLYTAVVPVVNHYSHVQVPVLLNLVFSSVKELGSLAVDFLRKFPEATQLKLLLSTIPLDFITCGILSIDIVLGLLQLKALFDDNFVTETEWSSLLSNLMNDFLISENNQVCVDKFKLLVDVLDAKFSVDTTVKSKLSSIQGKTTGLNVVRVPELGLAVPIFGLTATSP